MGDANGLPAAVGAKLDAPVRPSYHAGDQCPGTGSDGQDSEGRKRGEGALEILEEF